MHNGIILLCSRNCHNIVNQLYFNKTVKNEKNQTQQVESHILLLTSLKYITHLTFLLPYSHNHPGNIFQGFCFFFSFLSIALLSDTESWSFIFSFSHSPCLRQFILHLCRHGVSGFIIVDSSQSVCLRLLSPFHLAFESLPYQSFFFFYYYYFLIVISPIQYFFPTIQHGDPVTHICTHSMFAHYHAPS